MAVASSVVYVGEKGRSWNFIASEKHLRIIRKNAYALAT
jgi:hypothetical protein